MEQKLIQTCPNPACKRPYVIGPDFPKEVCPTCKMQDIVFNEKWRGGKTNED